MTIKFEAFSQPQFCFKTSSVLFVVFQTQCVFYFLKAPLFMHIFKLINNFNSIANISAFFLFSYDLQHAKQPNNCSFLVLLCNCTVLCNFSFLFQNRKVPVPKWCSNRLSLTIKTPKKWVYNPHMTTI